MRPEENETKNNINRTIEELRRDILRNTKAINDYQERKIQILTEIADSYLQSQKEKINSFQSAWAPYIENAYGMLYTFCPSPRRVSESYDNSFPITEYFFNTPLDRMQVAVQLFNWKPNYHVLIVRLPNCQRLIGGIC